MDAKETTEPVRSLDRRAFLTRSGVIGAGMLAAGVMPRAVREVAAQVRRDRPAITDGVASGDVSARRAVVWARADRPSRMLVEVSPTTSFRHPRRYLGPLATEYTDFTAQADLTGLPVGRDIFYRVRFQQLDNPAIVGEGVVGHLRTAPDEPRDVSFTWSGDTAGQGWGINPEFGGMRIYESMRALRPDFFIHSGDTVYADGPIPEMQPLPDGGVWRNVTTEEKSKVAETLHEFRGNYRYNLLDGNVRALNAEVPIFAQWDDHETLNNWYPGEVLEDERYRVRNVNLLARRAKRAFHEYMPVREIAAEYGRIYRKVSYGPLLDVFFLDMRTYRGPNTENTQDQRSRLTAILGRHQLRWLQHSLLASRATWKVIASDMPLGLVVPDGDLFEAVANDDEGAPLGRELELASLLRFVARWEVDNLVWLTADVHYTAAHYYDPRKAAQPNFTGFWEFVSGPLNAGGFGPNELDATFGPQVRFAKAPEIPNAPPSSESQFFGHVRIAGDSRVMTVDLKNLDGQTLYSVDLRPAAG
ncbi:MAG: alkaline phosphatase D family protein [Egibacteraceae bacterium]